MTWRRPRIKKRRSQASETATSDSDLHEPSWKSKKAIGKFLVDLFEAFMNS